ncbi:tRNA uracil 4-sulfurtransferase ThiI [Bacillus carboniphilus]|uniref:Probable tRNA sulfurtransferase n=1 Tax=Bacillus carboniphilus TaxID=86663 RepID=A0ABY9JZJ0_9BACI|nr:tRNA uracil 4-sulfurtransferase ThiI [Bacillus carboniphilus]WLR44189.1 tRNA uracil 4-sulfurtransferase ThiI [Bacillus carboniphilus]
MVEDHILVRFGELSTKGKNRKRFIDLLRKNIKQTLADYPELTYKATRDRIYIQLNRTPYEDLVKKLQYVFGIQSFSVAIKVETEINSIKEAALRTIKQQYKKGETFKVSARRSYKNFPLDTNQLNYEIGSHILIHTDELKVNVKNPDINVRVEVREEATYIMSRDYQGARGLPVGSSGKTMLMLSGGIDSPVAGYLAMKRGLEIEAVHFFSPPYTSERAKQKVLDLSAELTKYGGSIIVHIVPFTEIQEVIKKQVPENYSMTSTRRMMLRIADSIREKSNSLAITTGESLGQVASQTMESMYAINEVTTTPIIRPLITMDKMEIMNIAENIGTLSISTRPYEDCCTIFTPASPKTKPKKEKVMKYESFVDFEELIQKAVDNVETINISAKEKEDQFAHLL